MQFRSALLIVILMCTMCARVEGIPAHRKKQVMMNTTASMYPSNLCNQVECLQVRQLCDMSHHTGMCALKLESKMAVQTEPLTPKCWSYCAPSRARQRNRSHAGRHARLRIVERLDPGCVRTCRNDVVLCNLHVCAGGCMCMCMCM